MTAASSTARCGNAVAPDPRRWPAARVTLRGWSVRHRTRAAGLRTFQLDHLGWPPDDQRRPQLCDHLLKQVVSLPDGLRLSSPRRSVVLAWNLT
jgi:hypothetical protein